MFTQNQDNHQVVVKPYIQASLQHAGAFAADDVLFNWTEVKVPKTNCRLHGCTVMMRGTNGARQEHAFDLYFSKSDDYSLGTVNSAVSMQPNNDLVGSVPVKTKYYTDGLNTMEAINVERTQVVTALPDRHSDDFPPRGVLNTGVRSLFIAAVAQDAIDFQSTVKTTAAHSAGDTNDITVDTTSALINFSKGDLIHAHDDAVVGTLGSVPDATSLILENNTLNAQAIANNDDLYNVNPITIYLNFNYTYATAR